METNTSHSNKLPLQIGIGVIVVVLFFAIIFFTRQDSKSEVVESQETTQDTDEAASSMVIPSLEESPAHTETPTTSDQTQAPSSQTQPTVTSSYKDGSYSATGTYQSPGGPESVALSITLKDDVIVSAEATPESDNQTSQRFQKIFSDNYKTYVVGKKITELQLTKVAGSSLTPKGFNDALAKIKQQSKM